MEMSTETTAPTVAVHRKFASSDPNAVHDHVVDTFADHELRLERTDAVRFRLDTATTAGVTVGRMAYGTHVEIVGPAMRDCYHVNLLTSGASTVEQDGERASFSADHGRSGVVFGPDAPVGIDWSSDCAQYHLKLPRGAFEDHAARLAGCPSATIDFDLTFPLTSPAGQSLHSSVAFYYSQLANEGGLSAMPTVQRELESALMTQVLLVATSNLTPLLLAEPKRRGSDSAVRAAMDYIESNPTAELSVGRLAELVEVSARSLQTGFRRTTGVTPSEYIRNIRLDRARADILSGDGATVSDVASRWNFHHLGRFAHHYRERYGETPSYTVRNRTTRESSTNG